MKSISRALNLRGLQTRTLSTAAAATRPSDPSIYAQPVSHRRPVDTTPSTDSKYRAKYVTDPRTEQTTPRFSRNKDLEHAQSGPLRENHVAIRVKELCKTGQLKQAIDYCTNVPTAVQGPVAWNTIIQATLDAKQYNLAYSHFIAMKKRAIQPTVSTYHTLLTGYAHADPANLTHIQLQRAEKLYKDWSDLVSSEKAKPNKQTARLHPAATYIEVLANIGRYQKIWDIFYDLDGQGPMAPNERVFTSMFLALAKRSRAADVSPVAEQEPQPAGATTLLWRHVLRALDKQSFPIDSHLITAALRALRHGAEGEHELAFAIIHDYLGLKRPDTPTSVHSASSNLRLDHRALDAALETCESSGQPELIKPYIEAVVRSGDPHRAQAVTTPSMDRLLSYYATSGNARQAQETIDWMLREAALPNGLHVKPTSNSWALAFRACANAKDWGVAKELLDRLALTRNNTNEVKYSTIPSAEAAYFILKTAYESQAVDEQSHNKQLRTAFRVVEYISRLWTKETYSPKKLATLDSRTQRRLVFQNKLIGLLENLMGKLGNGEWMATYWRIVQMQTVLPEEVMRRHGTEN